MNNEEGGTNNNNDNDEVIPLKLPRKAIYLPLPESLGIVNEKVVLDWRGNKITPQEREDLKPQAFKSLEHAAAMRTSLPTERTHWGKLLNVLLVTTTIVVDQELKEHTVLICKEQTGCV